MCAFPLSRSHICDSFVALCWVQIKKVCEEKPEFLQSLADPTELRRKKTQNVHEIFSNVGVDRILINLFGAFRDMDGVVVD